MINQLNQSLFLQKWAPNLLLLFLIILITAVLKASFYIAIPGVYPAYMLGILILAAVGMRVSYQATDQVNCFAIRGLTIILGAYLVLAEPSFNAESNSMQGSLIWHFTWIRWVGVAAAAATWWRPSFGLITATSVIVSKALTVAILQISGLSPTDYLPVVEFLIILILGVLLSSLLLALQGHVTALKKLEWKNWLRDAPTIVFLFAVAIHFGNYFHSGLAKVLLDGPILAWIGNITPALMEIAEIAGHSPIALSPELAANLHTWMLNNYVLFNAVTLITQLGSIVALRRISWALWMTVFYDITHIVIALLTGIFFWKWILLNAIIVACLTQMRHSVISPGTYVLLVATVLFGQTVFFTGKLGWFDSQGFVHHYFNVVDSDDNTIRVPSNFFLSGSLTVAQNRMGTPSNKHFPLRTWGNARSYEIVEATRTGCTFSDQTHNIYPFDAKRLENYIRAHHNFMLARSPLLEQAGIDRYPHHIFSVPWLHTDFYNLDLRRVTHYEYVVESICLNNKFGDREDVIFARDLIVIPIKRPSVSGDS